MKKKDKPFKWVEDCEEAFIKIKEFMSIPLILNRLEDGETLFLYIATFDKVIGTVLMVEWDDE